MGMRYLCSELMNVRMLSADGVRHEAIGILEEISASAACLQLDERPGINTRIQFVAQETDGAAEMAGTVTKCEHEPGVGYYVVVRFGRSFRWHPAIYKPKHLFDCGRDFLRRPESAAHAGGQANILASRQAAIAGTAIAINHPGEA